MMADEEREAGHSAGRLPAGHLLIYRLRWKVS